MKTKKRSDYKYQKRTARVFSESFKQAIVKQIEKGEISISATSREFSVSSASVYKWLCRYSKFYKRGYRIVVEPMSDAKKIKELREQVKELERLLGQKQIELEYKNKIIEIAGERYGEDLEKKLDLKRYAGSKKITKNSPLK